MNTTPSTETQAEIQTETQEALTDQQTQETTTEQTETQETETETLSDDKAFAFDKIKVPEILDVDNELGNEFLGIMNNAELDRNGLAQAFLDLYAKGVEALLEERGMTWNDTNAQWKTDFKKDPHYGAQHADKNLGKVAKSINDFAAAEKERLGANAPDTGKLLREALSLTGAGNHPETLKFLIWLSDQSGEGAPLSGTPAGGDQSRADKMFG
ncbi:MAG: hypothetical protein KDA17_02815 [Candidatus Saccharibacteria bacterium]|nr:hypothetical protein [Candidatus Saccharibacteria bacterium]